MYTMKPWTLGTNVSDKEFGEMTDYMREMMWPYGNGWGASILGHSLGFGSH